MEESYRSFHWTDPMFICWNCRVSLTTILNRHQIVWFETCPNCGKKLVEGCWGMAEKPGPFPEIFFISVDGQITRP